MRIKWILVSRGTSLFVTINSVLVALITVNREKNLCCLSISIIIVSGVYA